MKRITAWILSVALLIGVLPLTSVAESVGAGEKLGWGVDYVKVTFMDETKDVLQEVMEIDGGMAAPLKFEWEYTRYVDLSFGLSQLKDGEFRTLLRTKENTCKVNADELEIGMPLRLDVYNSEGKWMDALPLGIRVNKGLIASRVPDTLSAEFQSGLKVDMSDLLPGMELDVLPFLIPVTVKTYTDGAIRVGIGVNSSDVDFWMKAGNGEMPEQQLGKDLKELFYGDPHALDDTKTKGMGVIVIVSGWAEGNMNDTSPIKGHIEIFIGTGFDIQSQYGIFTFEITLTGGGQGIFDFSFNYSEEDSEYHFSADEIRLGLKGGLELYGGVGCFLASVGVYGAASLAYQERLYPDAEVEHLILAGEFGLKAKLFGKVIACFKIVSGSHDFVFDKKKKSLGLSLNEAEFRQFLLDNDYANQELISLEAGKDFKWHGEFVETPNTLTGYEEDPNFAHLLATDVYPENHVQLVSTGSKTFPEMKLIFLGSDNTRNAGNRSTLMACYYDLNRAYISDPVIVHDDGTADFNPSLFAGSSGTSYLVWENAIATLESNATLAEIAAVTDIYYSDNITGNLWHSPDRLTHFAGTGVFATGAQVASDADGNPIVAYYTNDVNDPAGLSGTHEIYLVTREGFSGWKTEKFAEVNGAISGITVASFNGNPAIAVSWEEEGVKKVALYRFAKKVWEKTDASTGKFVHAGNNFAYLTWYENGQVKKLEPTLQESDLTPKEMIVPNSNYEIYGHLGYSTVMILSAASKDASGSAFALVSKNGGITWGRADLTKMNENAYVSHIAAAFTNENEPVIVYSLQNYEINVDIDETMKALDGETPTSGELEGGQRFFLGNDDDRFTDTRADLYIAARAANKHLTFVEGKAIEIENNKPGKNAKFKLTVRNTGLYDIEKANILWGGEVVGTITETITPWATADIEVEAPIPNVYGTETYEFTFGVSTKDDLTPDSTIRVPVHPGYLTATIFHSFRFGEESVRFRINNLGYTNKKARIIVRDEMRNVTLEERTVTIDAAWYVDSEYKAKGRVFAEDGIENVTVFILMEDEDLDSEGVSVNRVKSVSPLPESFAKAQAQPIKAPLEKEEKAPANTSNLIWIPIVLLGAAVILIVLRRIGLAREKKKAQEAAKKAAEASDNTQEETEKPQETAEKPEKE